MSSSHSEVGRTLYGHSQIIIMPGKYSVTRVHRNRKETASVDAHTFLEYFVQRVNPENPGAITVYNPSRSVAMAVVFIYPGDAPSAGPKGCAGACIPTSLRYLKSIGVVDASDFHQWLSNRRSSDAAVVDAQRTLERSLDAISASKARGKKGGKRRSPQGIFTYKAGRVVRLYEGDAAPAGLEMLKGRGIALASGIKNGNGKDVGPRLRAAMSDSGYNVVAPKKAHMIVIPDGASASALKRLPALLRDRSHHVSYSEFLTTYGITTTANRTSTAAAGDYGISDDVSASSIGGTSATPVAGAGAGAGAAPMREAAPKKRAPTAYNLYIRERTRQEKARMPKGTYSMPKMNKRFGAEWQTLTTEKARAFFAKNGVTNIPAAFVAPASKRL